MNIELIAYIPSLAHNPPLLSKISATSQQPTSLVAQEYQGHNRPTHRTTMASKVAVLMRT